MFKVAPYSLIQFTNDLYRSVRLDVILATFAWNFRSSAKIFKTRATELVFECSYVPKPDHSSLFCRLFEKLNSTYVFN